ncbi:SURF1 family protein [Nocardioides sp. C4-1]|uniref:SURF1 family cytochrome oxidase biogenesis protein n=1 Tax=Nocardioides sp. C4-1 TaxID=3151851 RepID=UPI003267D3B6
MGSYRFLLSRRWLLFGVVVILLSTFAWWLGEWQFGRLDEKKSSNSVVRTNENLPPAPVAEVLSPDQDVDPADEWRRVEATGTYDVDHTVVVRYRSNDDGAPGVQVVVPLVTDEGLSLAVDRGFLATDARSLAGIEVPPAPTGEVTVVGWVRVDGTGASTAVDLEPDGLSTRAISSDRIAQAVGRPFYDGFVDVETENGEPASGLAAHDLPDLGNGPHFFYGLQWWFFGVLALFGFGYLAYDERRRGPRGERQRPTRNPRPDRPDRPVKEKKVRQTNVRREFQRR